MIIKVFNTQHMIKFYATDTRITLELQISIRGANSMIPKLETYWDLNYLNSN